MKYRKLRIAWSVAWGVVAVLLCVLWVRSLSTRDLFYCHPHLGMLDINSMFGGFQFQCFLGADVGPNAKFIGVFSEPNQDWAPYWEVTAGPSKYGFRFTQFPTEFIVPHWFLIAGSLAASSMPWLSYRFSLRTLLIATTLVALGLGVVVWMT